MGRVPEGTVRMAMIGPGMGLGCEDGDGEAGGRGRAPGWSQVRDIRLYPQSAVKP